MALSGDGCFRVIVDIFEGMVLDGCGWLWVLPNSLGWIQIVFRDGQFQ